VGVSSQICDPDVIWTELRRLVNFEVSRSYFPTGSQSVSMSWHRVPLSEVWGYVTINGQSVSMSWRRALFGTCDQILILNFAVLSLLGALSDERSGLSLVSHCQQQLSIVNFFGGGHVTRYYFLSECYCQFMSCGGPKCRHCSQQFMHCCGCSSPWKSCLSGCCLDTDFRKRYLGSDLVTCGTFPWKALTILNINTYLSLVSLDSYCNLPSHWSGEVW
jgi:hypothetical protein